MKGWVLIRFGKGISGAQRKMGTVGIFNDAPLLYFLCVVYYTPHIMHLSQ